LVLLLVAGLVGAGTAIVLNALDDTNDSVTSSSQLERRNADAKPSVAYPDAAGLATAASISCTNATDSTVSTAGGPIGTTRFCDDPVTPLELAVLTPPFGPPQTCDFWKGLATEASNLDQAIHDADAPESLGRLLLVGPNWVVRSSLLAEPKLRQVQDAVGGDLLDLQLLEDSPPVPDGC
jgi:hypothetical protein